MSLFKELKRRNVIRVGIAYAVVSWLILQVADVILNNVSAPAWVFWATLMLLGIGFIIVVVFSWVFELTPEGLKREHEVDRSQSITGHTGEKLNRLIIGVLVLALGYFVVDKFVLSSARDAALVEATRQAISNEPAEGTAGQAAAVEAVENTADNSIAVLPFVNMSDDASNEYFSDGISEELLNLLAKVPELRVAARTSSFSLKGKEMQMSEIGDILNVGHVLEGSVRKAGNEVRITAQLIKIDDGFHMWSETYDRSLDNIFAVQDEIAWHVVEQLKITLLGEAPTAVEVDPQAYALFLQGRHLGRRFTQQGFEQSNELYRQALEIAPDYAAAWDGLGSNYTNIAVHGEVPVEQALMEARAATLKSLEIDPDFAKGHAGLGWISMIFDNDLATAATHFQKALSLRPTDLEIIGPSAVLTATLGRLDETIVLMEYLVARDPVNTTGHNNLALVYLFAGRLDEAIASSMTALKLSPDRIGPHSTIALCHLLKDEFELAKQANSRETNENSRLATQLLYLHSAGEETQFESLLAQFIERWGEEFPANIASAFAWAGRVDEAFEWLNKASEGSDPNLVTVHMDPTLRNIHDDPRWVPFLASINQAPEQRDAVKFEISLPE